jgi:hypothetical protein
LTSENVQKTIQLLEEKFGGVEDERSPGGSNQTTRDLLDFYDKLVLLAKEGDQQATMILYELQERQKANGQMGSTPSFNPHEFLLKHLLNQHFRQQQQYFVKYNLAATAQTVTSFLKPNTADPMKGVQGMAQAMATAGGAQQHAQLLKPNVNITNHQVKADLKQATSVEPIRSHPTLPRFDPAAAIRNALVGTTQQAATLNGHQQPQQTQATQQQPHQHYNNQNDIHRQVKYSLTKARLDLESKLSRFPTEAPSFLKNRQSIPCTTTNAQRTVIQF